MPEEQQTIPSESPPIRKLLVRYLLDGLAPIDLGTKMGFVAKVRR